MCNDADSNLETSMGNEATTLQLDNESSSGSDENLNSDAMSDTSENLGVSVAGLSSNSCSSSKASKKAKKVRSFDPNWKTTRPLLENTPDGIKCKLCLKYNKDNKFTQGCKNFKTTTLVKHRHHRQALQDEQQRATKMRNKASHLSVKQTTDQLLRSCYEAIPRI